MAEITTQEVKDYLALHQGQKIILNRLRSELGVEKYGLNGQITKSWKAIPNIMFQLEEQKIVRWLRRGVYAGVQVTTSQPKLQELEEGDSDVASVYAGVQVTTSQPAATKRPLAMEITPKTPYSNLLNLRQILQNCERRIWWADRYFNARGLDELIRNIDLALVREVRILSGPDNLDERAKREFARFREEMENGGVSAEWRVLKGFAHDRFIISDSACFVVPSIDTIVRGQYSQILETPNRPPFDEWWKVAIPIRDYKP